MRIKSLELRNIRSYVDGRVEFPAGSTLLSGDIGCGKSTLLHAIEFALFGTKRGDLDGTDLLRHGKSSGLVRLNFELGGNDIVIERGLKRSRDAISQDSGTIRINGHAETKTAVEMKSAVLDMLGYSQDMLKKNKPLFRYTVYTPQEQMKSIMWDEEHRLATLRTIFGVDKYGTIRNNAKILLTELRAMRREHEALSRDIDTDAAKLEELKDGKKNISHAVFDERLKLDEIERRLRKEQGAMDLLKKNFEDISEKKHELTRKETELRAKEARLGKLSREISAASNVISKLDTEMGDAPEAPAEELRSRLSDIERARDTLVSERAVLRKEIENLHPVYENGICSVCKQKVGNREEFKKHIDDKRKSLEEVENNLNDLSSSISDIKKIISSAENHAHLIRSRNEAAKRKGELEAEKTQLDSDVATLSADIDLLKPQLEKYNQLSAEIKSAESAVSSIISEKMSSERSMAKLEQQLENFDAHIAEINNRVRQKQQAKEKALRISEFVNWFDPFLALTESMEKHVMAAIQKEFDGYFKKWFGVVMGEQLSVKVDDKFAPKIEQNGYETEYDNLSGGEKTAVALAYRLALNKVINTMIDNIRTKDLLILDEPTDGFSTDQLDRIRDVISELKLNQVIIVSHEPKIDTYVDNVVRVFKENHVSRVAY
jgi:exonuclease SbcC